MAAMHRTTGSGNTERMIGRALALFWIFWVAQFTAGEVALALAGPLAQGAALLIIVALAAYAIWHWERIFAWVMLACCVIWPVAFPLIVSAAGGDNILAVTIVTFLYFAVPGLIAAALILDGERRLALGAWSGHAR